MFTGDNKVSTTTTIGHSSESGTVTTTDKSDTKGIKARLHASHTPRNKIEESRNATLFIETTWGVIGSGLIISDDCRVVTNRHILELDVAKETALGINSPLYAQIIAMEEMRVRAELSQMINEYQMMVQSQGETAESVQLLNEIEQRQAQLEDLPQQLKSDMENELKKIKRKGTSKATP